MFGFLDDFILSITPTLLYVEFETPSPAHARLLKQAWDVIAKPVDDGDEQNSFVESYGSSLCISGQADLEDCRAFREYAPTIVQAQLDTVRRVCDVFLPNE